MHKSIIGITILLLILGLATTLYFVIKSESKTIQTKQDIKTPIEKTKQASTPHLEPQTQARDSVVHSSKEVLQKPIEQTTTDVPAQNKKIELHAPKKEAASHTQAEQKKKILVSIKEMLRRTLKLMFPKRLKLEQTKVLLL